MPSYRVEGQIYGKYILSALPNAKIGTSLSARRSRPAITCNGRQGRARRPLRQDGGEGRKLTRSPTRPSTARSCRSKSSGADTVLVSGPIDEADRAGAAQDRTISAGCRRASFKSQLVVRRHSDPACSAISVGTIERGALQGHYGRRAARRKDPSVVKCRCNSPTNICRRQGQERQPLAFYGYGVRRDHSRKS